MYLQFLKAAHFVIDSLIFSDPFAEDEGISRGQSGQDGYIHIRIQQRNGRKTLTTVQGVSSEFDLKKIVKVAKKVITAALCSIFGSKALS